MKVKYLKHDANMPNLEFVGGVGHSCAIDLMNMEEIRIKPFEFKLINLGVSVDVPNGYKVDLRMRSSTFKKFGLIQTNALGLIDTTYRGAGDIIQVPVYCLPTRDKLVYLKGDNLDQEIIIPKYTRLCQIEIVKSMESDIELEPCLTVEDYGNTVDRGGFGSTGN